jgi:hypothetical protein
MRWPCLLLIATTTHALNVARLFGAKPKRADDMRGLSSLTVKGVCAHRWAPTTNEAHSILAPIAKAFDDLKIKYRDALVPELAPPPAGTELKTAGGNFHCYAAGADRGVPSCGGAFAPSTRLVSRNDGSGWSLFRFWAVSRRHDPGHALALRGRC